MFWPKKKSTPCPNCYCPPTQPPIVCPPTKPPQQCPAIKPEPITAAESEEDNDDFIEECCREPDSDDMDFGDDDIVKKTQQDSSYDIIVKPPIPVKPKPTKRVVTSKKPTTPWCQPWEVNANYECG